MGLNFSLGLPGPFSYSVRPSPAGGGQQRQEDLPWKWVAAPEGMTWEDVRAVVPKAAGDEGYVLVLEKKTPAADVYRLGRQTLDAWREEFFLRYPKERRVPGMALWKALSCPPPARETAADESCHNPEVASVISWLQRRSGHASNRPRPMSGTRPITLSSKWIAAEE